MTKYPVTLAIYDEKRQDWRALSVEASYVPKCGNSLHQFYPRAQRCACGAFERMPGEPSTTKES